MNAAPIATDTEWSLAQVFKSVGLALVATSIAACSGSGTNATSITASGSDVIVMDAPVTSLASFTVTVDELRLVDGSGTATADLLSQSVSVEFLGLQTSGSWLSNVSFPVGTYTAARVVFDSTSFVAKAKTGAAVPVTVASNTLDVIFPTPLVIGSSTDYNRVLIDLDLTDSLDGDVLGMTFTPSGNTEFNDGSTGQAIDEFRGIVSSFSEADNQVVLDAYVDDDLTVPLGSVTVDVQPTATLVRDDGLVFALPSDFYAILQASSTLIEVHGNLATGGRVAADKIEVEDQSAGAGVSSLVKIEGTVASLGVGTFDLMIREVEKGAAIASPVLSGLGNPSQITVSHDATTDFFRQDGTAAASTDLQVGQKIKVYFSDFLASPFPAYRVRIHHASSSEATIVDTTGLPTSVIVNIDGDEPLVTSGLVPSSSTNVTVDLTNSTLVLGTHMRPTVAAGDLQAGQEVEVEGGLAGLTITADKLKLRPGRMRGEVSAVTGPLAFTATLTNFKDPFGANVDQLGPYSILIDPAAEFRKDAANATEFMSLFTNLLPGEVLAIRVKGVGTTNSNEITAHVIEAEVR